MKTLCIISDTHGLLRPEALPYLQGCDLILHAGDLGNAEIFAALSEVAPTYAVRGNVDRGDWAEAFPLTQVLEWEGKYIYMIHILAEMDLDPAAAGMDLVVYGHSHKYSSAMKEGVLYLNPGSAGPHRFSLPVTLAKASLKDGAWELERIELQI